MKAFIVADVHGYYDLLMDTLKNAGYDINNPDHFFISLGDLIDRGGQSLDCIRFVNSIPEDRKVLIRGNHEDLLMEAVYRGYLLQHDIGNGTYETIHELAPECDLSTNCWASEVLKNEDWNKYYNSTVNFYETSTHVFVHGWFPTTVKPDWRDATDKKWKDARWYNGMYLWSKNFVVPNKVVFCGHWHTSYGHCWLHNEGSEFDEDANFDPFVDVGIIALDACTAYSGKMNCWVLKNLENETRC